MSSSSSHLRVLICSGNLGNAAPDPASVAAWLPLDGCLSEITKDPTTSLPSNQECHSFIKSMGLDDSNIVPTSLQQEPESTTTAPVSLDDNDDDNNKNDWFDIIVIGMQEATFSVEDMKRDMPEVLPLLQPIIQKAARKVKKEAEKGRAAVNQLTTDKDNLSPNKNKKQSPSKKSSFLDSILAAAPTEDSAILQELIAERLPSYDFCIRHQRGEMRLEVLVRQGLDVCVERVGAQNTGLGGVGVRGANKGGIVGVLRVEQTTRLAFCTAHLEAHEGLQKYKSRCSMLHDIFEGTADESLGIKYDVSLQAHYAFVLGDLNFRTELIQHEQLTKEQHNAQVRNMVENKQWLELNRADELFRGLRDRDLAVGFQTLPCLFPPTFKVERAAGYEYKQQRRPSYTDRVLWKCGHLLQNNVTPLAYEPIDAFVTSDHKPIRAAFEVPLNERIRKRPTMARRRSSVRDVMRRISFFGPPVQRENLHIFISNIKCHLLTTSNPYVAFVSDPKALVKHDRTVWSKFRNKLGLGLIETTEKQDGRLIRTARGWPRTRKLQKTDRPDWRDDQIHLVVQTHDKDGHPLNHSGSMLYLTVIDHTPASSSEHLNVIGTFAFNLAQLCIDARAKANHSNPHSRASGMWKAKPACKDMATSDLLQQPLLKGGKQRGTISCSIDACWVDDAVHDVAKSARHIKSKQSIRHKLRRMVTR